MNKRHVGSVYEDRAAEYLVSRGHSILARNFRGKTGEIDIISLDGSCVVFTEVKYRRDKKGGGALAAVGFPKQRTISKTALCYIIYRGLPSDTAFRFDVIGFEDDELVHIKNAFDYIP